MKAGAMSHRIQRTVLAALVAATSTLGITVSAQTPAGADTRQVSVPTISPAPRVETTLSQGFALPPQVSIVAGAQADQAALAETETVLTGVGVGFDVVSDDAATHAPVTIYLGTASDTPQTVDALAQLGVQGPSDLPAEGYVLAIGVGSDGHSRVVLSGVDATGTYYAAQSFRQVVLPARGQGRPFVPGLLVRDWPGFGFRGGMESFYGPEWSQTDRLNQVDFLAAHKMDTFFYGPAGDPRTGSTWSLPYGADELGRLQQVVQAAHARHVNFIYRISAEAPLVPKNGICHSSDTDRSKLLARLQQLWDIGVRQFVLAWDDVAGQFTCAADQQAYGSDPAPTAAAQTSVVDYVQQQFIDTHPGALPLITVPTEYYGDQSSTYRTRFDDLLAAQVQIYWTGPAVVSPAIKVADIAATQQAFPQHRLVLWDNYPVNDYAPNRLLLAPLNGREPGLAARALGVTFNELQEQEPSLIVLFTEADYAWNPDAYDAASSWERGLQELGGNYDGQLRTFAENNFSSVLDGRESLTLTPLIAAFEDAYTHFGDIQTAGRNLAAAFASTTAAVSDLQAGYSNGLFLSEAKPWLDKLALYGTAGQAAVNMLLAQTAGDPAQAWRERLTLETTMNKAAAIGQSVAPGVVDPFVAFARNESNGFFGTPWYGGGLTVTGTPAAAVGSRISAAADRNVATPYRAATAPVSGDALTVALPAARPLADVVVLQDPSAPATASVEAHESTGNWVQVGSINSGYSDVAVGGPPVDELRFTWAPGSPPPTVYEVIPRYADTLPATLSADRARRLVAAGSSQPVVLTLQGNTSQTLNATITASLPQGWTAQPASQPVALLSEGRTVAATYTFTISVPAGAASATYPLTFTAASPDGVRTVSAGVSVQVGTPSTLSYSNLVLSDAPTGYWRLGETAGTSAADASGNGLTGTYVSPVTLGVPGAISNDSDTAVALTGGYASVPDATPLHITGPFTLEAWIKPATTASDPGLGILERYDRPASNGYILRLAGGNHLQAWVLGPTGYAYATGATAITPGTWNHVAAVFNGTSLTLYVNGLSDGSRATSVTPGPGSGALRIGARGDDANQRFQGSIDEAALYNHALSGDQIATDYLTGVR